MPIRSKHQSITTLALVLAIVTAACAKSGNETVAGDSITIGGAADASASSDTGAMAGMKGMDGMKGMEGITDGSMAGMSSELHTHMMAMTGASADSMKRMVPMHRQMVANMIAKMNGEMRDMKMSSNTDWSGTVDSLRQELVRLPELSGSELTAMMPAHIARVTRLSAMHGQMMRAMAR